MVPPPAFDQPVYSPQKIAVVVAELAEQGVAPSAALGATPCSASSATTTAIFCGE